jgi:hypothetical protein
VSIPPPTAESEALITGNLGLALDIAERWHRKTRQPRDELQAVAYLGLIRGCRKYNPKRGTALSTAVVPFIQGEILHWFRDRGYAVKFPHKWREKWGLVQRLMVDPAVSFTEVQERSGLTADEIAEMFGAMKATVELDETEAVASFRDPDVEIQRLGPLQLLILKAWGNLQHADQGLLCAWWSNPRRHVYPRGPIQQFHYRLQSLLRGQRLSEVRQQSLAIDVPTVEPDKRPRRPRTRKVLDDMVVQFRLLA